MNNQTDPQLLRAYAEHRSEQAFAELVRRHVDFVYSAALRMVCDSHLAQDVTQSVFLALAKNAMHLTDRPVLSGWLHRTAQNIAAQTVRTDVRRRAREQEAAAMNELLSTESAASWEHIGPHLDTALGELSESDRDALLLRYFGRKSAQEMAQTLGITDEAAQKRVSRAVERLREFFAKRGVTVGASGLVVVISANAIQAAPIGLAVTISTSTALAGTTLATTTTAIKTIAVTTLQKTLVTATVAALTGVAIYETRQASQLHDQVQALQQQQTALTEQISQFQRERDDATNRLAGLLSENGRLRTNPNDTELLRLRGEVTRLQTAARELVQSQAGSNAMSDALLGATADAWTKRANSFKQWFEQNPDKSIPELNLLTDADWLFEASRNLQVSTNRSEGNDIHMIADRLRHTAKSRFAGFLGHAFGNYVAANAGYLPDGLPQLLPYFAPAGDASPFARSVDSSILQRYELLHTGRISDVPPGAPIVREKAPVDDVIDAVLSITIGGYSMQSTGKVKDMMRQGEPLSWSSEDVEKIKPFLK